MDSEIKKKLENDSNGLFTYEYIALLTLTGYYPT